MKSSTLCVSAWKAANSVPLAAMPMPAISSGMRGPQFPTSRPDSGAQTKVIAAIGSM